MIDLFLVTDCLIHVLTYFGLCLKEIYLFFLVQIHSCLFPYFLLSLTYKKISKNYLSSFGMKD